MIRNKCCDYLDTGSDICYLFYAAIRLVASRFSAALRQPAVERGSGSRLVMKYVLSGWLDDNESLGLHWNCIAVHTKCEMFLSIEFQTDAISRFEIIYQADCIILALWLIVRTKEGDNRGEKLLMSRGEHYRITVLCCNLVYVYNFRL